jgi:hydroxyacylglutathione hydrolase
MHYRIIPVTPFQQNCSLVWCEQTMQGTFIDPGGEADRLLAAAEAEGVSIGQVLLTHGHIDHVGAGRELADRLGVPLVGPQREDAFWLKALPEQCQMFGFPPVEPFTPDRWLEGGDVVQFGLVELAVIHTPGHTPGHVVFHHAPSRTAFVGDVLFKGSIGRSDFPRGDHRDLIASIKERLLPLGDDVSFVPGHGPVSSFGFERRNNPFLT